MWTLGNQSNFVVIMHLILLKKSPFFLAAIQPMTGKIKDAGEKVPKVSPQEGFCGTQRAKINL